jgi:hypothetical protein
MNSQQHARNQRESNKKPIQPFYFKSYDKVIGVAHNLTELNREMKRLASEDRMALEYHLASGHIVDWLEYSGEWELAFQLKGVKNADEANRWTERYLEREITLRRMTHGRMS